MTSQPRSHASSTETSSSASGGANTARLHGGLDSLLELTDELGRTLAAERERLVARDWDAILQLAEQKDSLVQRLQAQSQEFEKACANAIAATAAPSLLAMLDAAGLGTAHATLRMRAAHLQRANRESRALLDHHLSRVDTALRLMNRSDAPSSSSLGLYGRDGFGRMGGTGRRLAEA